MGKSFIRLIFILGYCNISFAQDSLCVFKTKGVVLMEFLHQKKPLSKGDFIPQHSKLSVLSNSEITVLNANGNVYFIDKAGNYTFKNLITFKDKAQNASVTTNYFKYIWNELVGKNSNTAIIAGVYRGEILMKFPKDSSQIYNSKIAFTWDFDENENLYYVFLKNVITQKIIKIETNGSQLAIYKDNSIFDNSEMFQWAVSTEAFPNIENMPFYTFKLISRNQYLQLMEAYKGFVEDLKTFGTSDSEIKDILCETYKLCN
tara:strand:+ start:32929 stop:33708 length:780 start_codon:yes stop_codon:yes gene_type:complete